MIQWIPVLVTLLTVALGALTYLFQKRRDRKEELIKIRRSEYRKWMESFYDITGTDNPSALFELNKATNDLFLYASDDVIEAVGRFKDYMASTSPGRNSRDMREAGRLLAVAIREMRKDCFEKTRLSEAEIRNMLPIEGMRD